MLWLAAVEKACSKDNEARACTPATRSPMTVLGSPAAGKQSCNAAILRQNRSAMLAGDSREARGEIRWTGQLGEIQLLFPILPA
jgi:hypothetical protein